MEILIHPDKMLSTAAKVIGVINDSLQNLIDDMIKTMIDNNGLGLAAPQVGESKRLFVYGYQDLPMVLINPVIGTVDGKTSTQEEACLSVINFQAHVVRASKIIVIGLDREGTEQRFEANGMLARIIHHEVDHLDGKLFIDRVSRQVRRAYDRKLQKGLKKGGNNVQGRVY